MSRSSPGSTAGRRGPRSATLPNFTPLMLSQPLEEDDLAALDPGAYFAEWKWDGIRVQLVARGTASGGSIRAPATRSARPSR
jgi:ATP-dependent DNA ligase